MTMQSTPSTTLMLTEEEAEILNGLLGNDLKTLRDEIYKTEKYEMREALKRRELLIRGL
ncbi:MAG: hypothetical protein ACYDCQ_06335 [Dehalococcoidia bacterium]